MFADENTDFVTMLAARAGILEVDHRADAVRFTLPFYRATRAAVTRGMQPVARVEAAVDRFMPGAGPEERSLVFTLACDIMYNTEPRFFGNVLMPAKRGPRFDPGEIERARSSSGLRGYRGPRG